MRDPSGDFLIRNTESQVQGPTWPSRATFPPPAGAHVTLEGFPRESLQKLPGLGVAAVPYGAASTLGAQGRSFPVVRSKASRLFRVTSPAPPGATPAGRALLKRPPA